MLKSNSLSRLLSSLVCLCLLAPVSLAENLPLKIGLLPYLSPDFLMQRYTPFVHYVESQLKRPVQVSTAPNFPSYVQRAADYQYELYVTAPHFAALAEAKHGYRRVARLTRELDGAIVVHEESPIQQIAELKNKVLATPDHLAIITILGELSLQEHGIDPTKDISIKSAPSHNTALLEVIHKRADAAVVSAAVFESMKPEQKRHLRLIDSTDRVPHMMFLASPKMSEEDFNALKESVLAFTAQGAGRNFFEESGYIDMQPISETDMDRMRAMLPLLEPRLH